MLSYEEVITKILSIRSDLTKKNIHDLIQKKRNRVGRLLTEEGAAHLVANELGINLSGKTTLKTTIKIKDLIVGTNDVTITVKVESVYPATTFTRKDGVEGQVARLIVSDETGIINITLWDEKAEMVSRGMFSQNQTIRVEHGYIRNNLDGRPALNIGQRGSITILSSDSNDIKSVVVKRGFKKIRDVREDDYYVNIVGVVLGVSPITVFTRKNKAKGQVMRIRLADETGRIRVVFWDEKADLLKRVKKNSCLRITEGQIRKGLGGVVEVHVGRFSQVIILPDTTREIVPSILLTKMARLNPNMSDVDVLGRVVSVGQVREFSRPSGGIGRVGDLFLMDETGTIRLSLWNEKGDLLERISIGDTVLVGGAYTRERLVGVGLNLGKMGTLTVNPDMEEIKTLPEVSKKATPIGQLKVGLNTFVEGRISEAPSVRTITTRDGREMNVVSLRIRDSTGEIQVSDGINESKHSIDVSLWGRLADKAEDLPVGTKLRFKNIFARISFHGGLELTSRSITEMEVHKEGGEETEKAPSESESEGAGVPSFLEG